MREQVLFAKRLSFLVKAGVSLHESLVIIQNQTKSKQKKRIFETVAHDVASGQYLSKSLGNYQNLFGTFSINIIRIGEHTGTLSLNLTYLAEELQKRHMLRRKVLGALIYPLFITVATIAVTGTLVMFIFPKLMPIFSSLNIALPFTTKILLAISTYLQSWWLATLLATIIGFTLFFVLRASWLPLQRVTDRVLLALPIAGNIARAYNATDFCRTLRLTINAGIGIAEGLTTVAHITKNTIYRDEYLAMADHVLRGDKISTVMLRDAHVFPDMLPHMILIGETTGSLTETLEYLTELYEADIEDRARNLSNSIEPILLMIMGLLVGLIAVSVITPVYEVTRHMQTTY
jgi:type II secretory pathway component PulF